MTWYIVHHNIVLYSNAHTHIHTHTHKRTSNIMNASWCIEVASDQTYTHTNKHTLLHTLTHLHTYTQTSCLNLDIGTTMISACTLSMLTDHNVIHISIDMSDSVFV